MRNWFAEHPAPAVRLLASTRRDEGWPAGFLLAAATGALAMFTAQVLDSILGGLFPWAADPRPFTDLSFAAGALVWAAVLVPAWSQPAPTSSTVTATTRWPGVGGSTFGLTVGYFLPAPGATLSHGAAPFAGHLPPIVAGWAMIALGVSAIAAGLATATVTACDRARRVGGTLAAVLGAAAVATTAFGLGRLVLAQHVRSADPAVNRILLIVQSESRWWSWTPSALVLAALICVLTARTMPRAGLTGLPRAHPGRTGVASPVPAHPRSGRPWDRSCRS
jgi:hypothetical protein